MKFLGTIIFFFYTVFVTPTVLKERALRTIYTQIKESTGTRIIGGYQARAGQFPYAAAIRSETYDSSFFCGGAILSTLWILTAGHCVENGVSFTVAVGSNTLSEDDFNRITVSTPYYILHPNFNRTTLDNNIGLIQLRENIRFSDYIGRLYLPVTEYNDNVGVTAIGWGQISDSEPGPVQHLNYVKLVTTSNNYCKSIYGSQITDNMLCVYGNNIEGTCTGDSGGPLIYFLNNRHPIAVGVASFISSKGCESVDPSGYVRVFPYRDWILNITGSLDN